MEWFREGGGWWERSQKLTSSLDSSQPLRGGGVAEVVSNRAKNFVETKRNTTISPPCIESLVKSRRWSSGRSKTLPRRSESSTRRELISFAGSVDPVADDRAPSLNPEEESRWKESVSGYGLRSTRVTNTKGCDVGERPTTRRSRELNGRDLTCPPMTVIPRHLISSSSYDP